MLRPGWRPAESAELAEDRPRSSRPLAIRTAVQIAGGTACRRIEGSAVSGRQAATRRSVRASRTKRATPSVVTNSASQREVLTFTITTGQCTVRPRSGNAECMMSGQVWPCPDLCSGRLAVVRARCAGRRRSAGHRATRPAIDGTGSGGAGNIKGVLHARERLGTIRG